MSSLAARRAANAVHDAARATPAEEAVADRLEDEPQRLPDAEPPASASPSAIAMNSSGTQIPSFSPLSTLSPCRIRDGSRGSVTTAWPSAASVGASTMARTSASLQASDPKTTGRERVPRATVSGSPIAEQPRRDRVLARRPRRSIRDASVKRMSVSVASASTLTGSPLALGSSQSKTFGPTSSPSRRRRSRP